MPYKVRLSPLELATGPANSKAGPAAADHLQALTSYDLRALTFGRSAFVPLEGINVHVARGGYTGEDGFEVSHLPVVLNPCYLLIPNQISVPPAHATFLASTILRSPVQLAGLGARDSLRLEAGMCLYGNDLDESTTPVEAGLSWVIGKDRRTTGNFIGSKTVLDQLKNGPPRRRVGLIVEEAPARRPCPPNFRLFILSFGLFQRARRCLHQKLQTRSVRLLSRVD